ncbi:MAG: class I adenylate-forming enzyme family protein, partial [Anaerolineae bacterium]|nr:class I adenylate-forming enzyme family protein [Anaerolineae bacterium]
MRTRTIRLVQEILEDNLEVHPEKVALICDGRRLTYVQIDEMAQRLANALSDHGVRRGDRILIYLLNSVEAVVSAFAALKAGAIFSVVDYATKPDKLASIAADCTAMALITHSHQAELAAQLMDATPSLKFALLTGETGGWQGA